MKKEFKFTKSLFTRIKRACREKQKNIYSSHWQNFGVNIWHDGSFEITFGLNSSDCVHYIPVTSFCPGMTFKYFKEYILEI